MTDKNYDQKILARLVTVKMPYGLHKGVPLAQLPLSYLEFFKHSGFPDGKLGTLLSTLYEIKLNKDESIFEGL